jgi:hypothetical protein
MIVRGDAKTQMENATLRALGTVEPWSSCRGQKVLPRQQKSSMAPETPRHHISRVSVGIRISGAVGQFYYFFFIFFLFFLHKLKYT